MSFVARWMNRCRKWMPCLVAASICSLGAQTSAAQTFTPIHSIMQNLPNSPYLGQSVTVAGSVAGVLTTGGFYIQDGGNNGIEIFAAAGSNPACASVGNAVTVSGTVVNGSAVNGANTPGTGINLASCTVTGTNAVNTGLVTLTSATSYAQDLPLTGMSVVNSTFYAVSPTGGTTNATTGIVSSNGQFWVDLAVPTNGHLFKSAGLELDNFYPPPPAPAKGSSPGIPTWSGNPQRLFVDTTSFGGTPVDIGAGQTLTCKASATPGAAAGVGLIDYSLGYNRLLIYKTTTCTVSGNIAPSITSPADSQHFHVGTLNLNNFYGSATPAYATRLAKAALALVNVFGSPDIVSVQEVQDLATLQAIGDAANALPGSTTSYQAYWAASNDSTNLALGFLVNTNTVAVSKVYQVDVSDTFTMLNGSTEPLWERPPFVLEAGLLRAGQNYQVEVINIETTSRDGIDDPTNGPNVWERRGQQAEELSMFANAEQGRGQNLIIAGEFNAYSFSDGFVDVTDIVDNGNGLPATGAVAQYEPSVTNPGMYNFVGSITVSNSTYNIIESGNARSVEHILCSETQSSSAAGSLYSYISFVTQPHWTTDFPAVNANDPTIPSGFTARDGFVGAFLIPPVPTHASLTPSTLNFGTVYRGATASQTLTFTNTSPFPSTVNVSNISISGTNASDFTQTSHCTAVSQGASCTITVTYAPSVAGAETATLTVTSDSGVNPTLTATLNGTGLDTTATLSPASATLPSTEVGATSAVQSFTFNDTSPLPETVGAAAATGDFAVTSSTCGQVAASGICTISVVFRPTATGARSGVLSVVNSSTGDSVLTAALSGTGLDTTATLSPGSATYPVTPLGTNSTPQSFTWRNTSVVPLNVTGVSVTGDYAVVSNTCTGSVAAGASCLVSVVFSPVAAGTRVGTLTVQSTSTAETTLTASLTGTGTANIGASPSPLNAGNVDLGATGLPSGITITNYSSHVIALNAVSITGPYTFTSQCGNSVAAMSMCMLYVTFRPVALGAQPGTLSVTTSDPGVPVLNIPLTGNGVDFSIAVAPGSGSVLAGLSANFSATLTPLGGYSAPVQVACAVPGNMGGSTCTTGTTVAGLTSVTAVNISATTTAQYTVIGYTGGVRGGWLAVLSGVITLLLFTGRRRRRVWSMLLLVVSFSAVAASLGCGDKLPAHNVDPTYPGTYTYTVTASDGFLTHSATFNLSVAAK